MAENRLATTVAQGYRRLGMRGQPLIAAHSQLAQILRNRLGREHAELFARPNLDPTTGSIEWFTSRAGTPTLVSALDAQQRTSLEALTDQLLREVEQLAEKLKREGDTAELASQMLSGALQRPPGDWLYEVDGKPVLIMWGHLPEGGANTAAGAGGAAAAVSSAPASATSSASASSASSASAPAMAGAGAAAATVPATVAGSSLLRRWWWLWLLLALLLLLLVLRQCTAPIDPVTIGTATIPPPPTTPAIDDALARQRALLEELSRLRQARLDGVRALECVRVQPDAPTLVPRPTGGIAAAGPDGGGAGIGGPGITARSGATTGPAPDAGTGPGAIAAGPGTTVPGGDPDRTGAPADAANPGRPLPPVALGPQGPVDPGRLPELPPPDTGKPLTIPPDAPRDGKPSFLQGNWSAGPGLTSTKNKPIDLSLVLGDDGKGQVVIRRKDDGSTCVGPVDAQMRQGRLAVAGSGAVVCNRGEPFEMPRFECAPDARGRTQCNGINRDGSTYEMDIYQGRRS
ncbi:MAG TPA: SrfA family protein [Burkholderiaceae bacterium]|nr:SrfA family protein [Burkholderiaceae bacterium]